MRPPAALCTVWAPTQNPGGACEIAAKLTGLPVERVTVNTTFLGGGFGRRGQVDYVVDAVEVAKAIGGGPVKVLWAREDDMTHGFYRPNTHNVFRAALDASGRPTAWFTRAVGAGLLRQRGNVAAGQVDGTSMAGLRDLPYDIPNVRIEWVDKDVGVPITLDAGRVQQTNFHTYPMLRIPEVPVTEVHILDSGQPPGGLGEPGVPTVAPAVCNAVFALTGKRIRRLPIARDELKRT
jgi:CO/xanthine dehydrogenase Mo-binding subunit